MQTKYKMVSSEVRRRVRTCCMKFLLWKWNSTSLDVLHTKQRHFCKVVQVVLGLKIRFCNSNVMLCTHMILSNNRVHLLAALACRTLLFCGDEVSVLGTVFPTFGKTCPPSCFVYSRSCAEKFNFELCSWTMIHYQSCHQIKEDIFGLVMHFRRCLKCIIFFWSLNPWHTAHLITGVFCHWWSRVSSGRYIDKGKNSQSQGMHQIKHCQAIFSFVSAMFWTSKSTSNARRFTLGGVESVVSRNALLWNALLSSNFSILRFPFVGGWFRDS